MRFTNDVFTMAELAAAAGVPIRDVEDLRDEGELHFVAPGFIAGPEALRAGRALRVRASADPMSRAMLFESTDTAERHPALPAAVSGAAHALALGLAVLATGLGSSTAAARYDPADFDQTRLVFLSTPGPGGGGGGGGLRQPAPPASAQRQGEFRLRSPVPPPQPEPVEVLEKPALPEPPLVEEPPVVAPVASQPSDDRDQAGVAQEAPVTVASRGPGSGGGAGTGTGTGRGEGDGAGIGPGSGGGIGGGPYRPGSGIEPPRVLREVRADYTEDARRRGITGEVVLEIVVRRDGNVGDIRLIEGLGYGLDQQAIDAVRAWRFAPATRLGTPVDVLVEVAVEFRLR
jgi:TonB family protein